MRLAGFNLTLHVSDISAEERRDLEKNGFIYAQIDMDENEMWDISMDFDPDDDKFVNIKNNIMVSPNGAICIIDDDGFYRQIGGTSKQNDLDTVNELFGSVPKTSTLEESREERLSKI